MLNAVNDPMAGGVQNSVSGIQIARDPGQLGGFYYLTEAEASQRYGAQASPLYAGIYQYVQVVATSVAPAQGRAACYSVLPTSYTNSLQNYIVTATTTVENQSFFAGVFLNAITPGNFGWIQIAGVATCQLIATLTGTTGIGAVVTLDPVGTTGKFDTALAAAQTTALAKLNVGTAITAAANGALIQVLLKGYDWNF